MTDTGLTHHLTLPDASDEASPHAPPLHLVVEADGRGVTLQVLNDKDDPASYGCDVYLEHYAGRLVAYLAPNDNPDQHRYRVVLGRVQDGRLVPYEPAADESDELEIDTRA